nr:dynein assembly factor with WDR repeat domains 1 [Ipomoea batatas]GMD46622.1 dynein assembly factor with WDR repeat domains 1 [Ipomoea batatas]
MITFRKLIINHRKHDIDKLLIVVTSPLLPPNIHPILQDGINILCSFFHGLDMAFIIQPPEKPKWKYGIPGDKLTPQIHNLAEHLLQTLCLLVHHSVTSVLIPPAGHNLHDQIQVGRAAKCLSLVVKQSLTPSQLLTTRIRDMPRRMVNTGPYLSAHSLNVLTNGTEVRKRWRWPIIGHAPPASGAKFLPCFRHENQAHTKVAMPRIVDIHETASMMLTLRSLTSYDDRNS